MRLNRKVSGPFLTLCLALAYALTTVPEASAQSTRNLNRTVKAGKEIEFQWLNFNERTCRDYGYPKLVIEKAPKLGRYRSVKRKFTQQSGKCKGQKFSVLLFYYVAGRTKGRDQSSIILQGQNNSRINLSVQIQ